MDIIRAFQRLTVSGRFLWRCSRLVCIKIAVCRTLFFRRNVAYPQLDFNHNAVNVQSSLLQRITPAILRFPCRNHLKVVDRFTKVLGQNFLRRKSANLGQVGLLGCIISVSGGYSQSSQMCACAPVAWMAAGACG